MDIAYEQHRQIYSPALQLVYHIWRSEGHQAKHSWRRLNGALSSGLSLAIRAHMRFALEDFILLERLPSKGGFNGSYWMHIEGAYNHACGASWYAHGVNMSACHAIEHRLGRKPYLWAQPDTKASKMRLAVGIQFDWQGMPVTVTSFNDAKGYLTACGYGWERKTPDAEEQYRLKRRFRITHADLAAHAKALRQSTGESNE